jgi:hypothetical protein
MSHSRTPLSSRDRNSVRYAYYIGVIVLATLLTYYFLITPSFMAPLLGILLSRQFMGDLTKVFVPGEDFQAIGLGPFDFSWLFVVLVLALALLSFLGVINLQLLHL